MLGHTLRLTNYIFKNHHILNTSDAINNLNLVNKLVLSRQLTIAASAQPLAKSSGAETKKDYFFKDDPDKFGTLSIGYTAKEEIVDKGDVKEEEFLSEKPLASQKLRTKQYADMIKAHLRKRKLKEALNVLEVRMIQEDRVKPENYIYNLLLGACGRVGYTKKAFMMYNQMKKRGLKATGGTYTALFNACANSPWPEDGLTRARHLRQLMIEKGHIANVPTYNSMIKAFGRCGDLETAFSLVDEMVNEKLPVREDTLNFLLQACISDKDAGFRHALLVWRKFITKKIKPGIFSYNLMLRSVRECGLGDLEVTHNIIKELTDQEVPVLPEVKMIEERTINAEVNKHEVNLAVFENRPNLMAPVPRLGSVLVLSEVIKPEDRLLLLGGMTGFLENMKENGVAPDIKTCTQMLEIIPGTTAAEDRLLTHMKKFDVKPDTDFFNILIKKRSMRLDYEGAKDVVLLIENAKLKPNVVTLGVLALGCTSQDDAESILHSMEATGLRLNIEVLGSMLKNACLALDFSYVHKIMDITTKENINPNKAFLSHLETFNKRCADLYPSKSKNFKLKYKNFKIQYREWLKNVTLDPSEDTHPWEQYRRESETDVKFYKDKESEVRFKPMIKSRYRVKTGTLP